MFCARPARRLAYALWTNAPRWTHSFALGPGAIIAVATGAVTFSLTAEIFWEGLKAGLVTFGGAYTVIPYLHDAAVDGQHWLTRTVPARAGRHLQNVLDTHVVIG